MKRERLHCVPVKEMPDTVLEYYLMTDDWEPTDRYGITIVKRCESDPVVEYASIAHIGGDRREICDLIDRLACGVTFPVSLAEILDDYLATYDEKREEVDS